MTSYISSNTSLSPIKASITSLHILTFGYFSLSLCSVLIRVNWRFVSLRCTSPSLFVLCTENSIAWSATNIMIRAMRHASEQTYTGRGRHFLPEALALFLPFPNDLPSKPGRPLSFGLFPFRLSFLRSLRAAMLSARFFCRAAIEVDTCSFLSSLYANK